LHTNSKFDGIVRTRYIKSLMEQNVECELSLSHSILGNVPNTINECKRFTLQLRINIVNELEGEHKESDDLDEPSRRSY
jgi:hypothetical protein